MNEFDPTPPNETGRADHIPGATSESPVAERPNADSPAPLSRSIPSPDQSTPAMNPHGNAGQDCGVGFRTERLDRSRRRRSQLRRSDFPSVWRRPVPRPQKRRSPEAAPLRSAPKVRTPGQDRQWEGRLARSASLQSRDSQSRRRPVGARPSTKILPRSIRKVRNLYPPTH